MERWPKKFKTELHEGQGKTEIVAASCMNDRNTKRMNNKGKQMQQRDVEWL